MLTVLDDKGYKVDKAKLHYCQIEVLYIGQTIFQNGLQILSETAETIRKIAKPTTVREMQQFLELYNYYREWVFDYSTYTRPFLGALKESQKGHKAIHWMTEITEAFEELKVAICTAPL
ncbi:uncharacterized protein [Ambystoma mexicanum]|uniref:uncharacterized protein n=1 Tax=Ambystoma mexicanum TaxID=8296 RepID=UPI0037E7C5E9